MGPGSRQVAMEGGRMHVLLLSWDALGRSKGPTGQAAGLAIALATAGHHVHLLSRSVDGTAVRAHDGLTVELVAEAPPIVPPSLADPVLSTLAFAGRATSVAVRRLEKRPVDVVHAQGWATGPVVAALRRSHDVPVVAVVEAAELDHPDATRAGFAAALVATADVHAQRTGTGHVLPPGVALPPRRPGRPPRRGPVFLAAPRGTDHRAFARSLRASLVEPRRITASWSRRPAVVVALDPGDLDTVVRGLAVGVPVVTVPGPTGGLVASAGAGIVAGDDPAAVARVVDRLLADRARATALGRAAADAAVAHAWPRVASAWTELAALAVERATTPRLRAAR